MACRCSCADSVDKLQEGNPTLHPQEGNKITPARESYRVFRCIGRWQVDGRRRAQRGCQCRSSWPYVWFEFFFLCQDS